MKKIFPLALFALFFVACSEDSVNDISENPKKEETENKEENNNDKITFTNDILPIIQGNCGSCHLPGGGQTNYTNYTLSKNAAAEILRRIKLPNSSPEFMPRGRNPLSNTQIELFNQWITDGKLE